VDDPRQRHQQVKRITESGLSKQKSLIIAPDALPSYLIPTPLATGRCLFIRQDQAVTFEPEIAVLIGSDVMRPRAHFRAMNHSALFLTHLVAAAISEESIVRAKFLRVSRFFWISPVRVMGIGEGHAHVPRCVVHEVANWIRTIFRIGLELAI